MQITHFITRPDLSPEAEQGETEDILLTIDATFRPAPERGTSYRRSFDAPEEDESTLDRITAERWNGERIEVKLTSAEEREIWQKIEREVDTEAFA